MMNNELVAQESSLDLQELEIDTFEVEELNTLDVDSSVDISISLCSSSSTCSSSCG